MFQEVITPRFGEIDFLGHVNNTVLPQWFEHARNPIYRIFIPEFKYEELNLILAHFDVDFKSQMFMNFPVEIKSYISHIGNSSFTIFQEAWQNGKLCVSGSTVIVYFDFQTQKSCPIPEHYKQKLPEHLITK